MSIDLNLEIDVPNVQSILLLTGSRSIEVVKMLLASGVDVNHKNMLGMNALLLVAGYGNDMLVKLVLEAGADPNAANDFGHSALHLAVVGKRSQVRKTRAIYVL